MTSPYIGVTWSMGALVTRLSLIFPVDYCADLVRDVGGWAGRCFEASGADAAIIEIVAFDAAAAEPERSLTCGSPALVPTGGSTLLSLLGAERLPVGDATFGLSLNQPIMGAATVALGQVCNL